jgi:hypothetical protein
MLDFEIHVVHLLVSTTETEMKCLKDVNVIERLGNRAGIVPWAAYRRGHNVNAWRRKPVMGHGRDSAPSVLHLGTRPSDGADTSARRPIL